MMLYVNGYSCRNVLLGLIVVVLSVSCDTSSGVGDYYIPPPYNPPPVDDTVGGIDVTTLPYSYLDSTDSYGLVDLAPLLSSYGYVVSNEQNVQIKDSNGEALPNIWVYYWIDQQTDLIYIKSEDPNHVLTKSYQVLSIRDILAIASVSGSTGIIIAPLIEVIMKAYATYGTLSSIGSLFSLDIYFSTQRGEIVFEGTVDEIYNSLSVLSAVAKLPVVLKRNINKSVSGKITADKASKINPDSASTDLMEYLQDIGGYILANDDTRIRVTLNMLDGRERYLDVEVLSDTPLDSDMLTYFVRVAMKGDLSSFQYDIPFLWLGEEPDFYATIKVGDRYTERTETSLNDYVTELLFLDGNVEIPFPIYIGEEIEITILDEDLVFDDEIGRVVLNFNGYTFSYTQTSYHSGQQIAREDIGFR